MKKRILQIVTSVNGGGVDSVVYNYLSHMDLSPFDVDLIALDFGTPQFREEQFKQLGVNVILIPKAFLKRIKAVWSIIRKGNYNVIHSHCEFLSEWYLLFAKILGVKTRIMHSHIANAQISTIKKLYRPIGHFIAKLSANNFFGCGIDAAISLWGQKLYDKDLCHVMNNAVDLEKFRFDENKRNEIRAQYNWKEKFVLMNVGRFMPQKNHIFLLNLFKEIVVDCPNLCLVLVGDGTLKKDSEKWVKEHNLKDKVYFLGNRTDVPELLNAADCFILPSLFEGLPVVSIESQCNGLPIVMSDQVTKECGITELASFVSLEAKSDQWIERIFSKHKDARVSYPEKIKQAGFDIATEAKKLHDFYLTK